MAADQDRQNTDVQQTGGEQQRNRELVPGEGSRVNYTASTLEERDLRRQQIVDELREVDRKIEASNGYRVRNRRQFLEKSYFVFDANHLNLRYVLDEFEQPVVFLKLWEEKNRNRFDLFVSDVIRLFHNYVAGAKTLLDHTRTLQKDLYRDTDFSEEYRTRRNEQFNDSPLPNFVKDLLVYMLHEGLPLALAELSFGRVGGGIEVNSAVRLDVSKLREWERWSEKGREYLDTLGDKAKLADIVNEHAAIVDDFYRWFLARQSELEQEALKELEELEARREYLHQELESLGGFLEILQETLERTATTTREEREEPAEEPEEQTEHPEWEQDRKELARQPEEQTEHPEREQREFAGQAEEQRKHDELEQTLATLTKELLEQEKGREQGQADRAEAPPEPEKRNKGFWRSLFGRD